MMNMTFNYTPGVLELFQKETPPPKKKYREGIKRPRVTEEQKEKIMMLSRYRIPYAVIGRVVGPSGGTVKKIIEDSHVRNL